MSLSSVQSTLSTLKSCQADIGGCMDMVSDVALGIVEAQGEWFLKDHVTLKTGVMTAENSAFFWTYFSKCTLYLISGMDNSPALKKLEEMILECSRLDREINCFVESVDEMTAQVCLNCHWCFILTQSLCQVSHRATLAFFLCSVGQTWTSRGHGSPEKLCKGAFQWTYGWSYRCRPTKAQQGCCLQRQCQEICHARWGTHPLLQHKTAVFSTL